MKILAELPQGNKPQSSLIRIFFSIGSHVQKQYTTLGVEKAYNLVTTCCVNALYNLITLISILIYSTMLLVQYLLQKLHLLISCAAVPIFIVYMRGFYTWFFYIGFYTFILSWRNPPIICTSLLLLLDNLCWAQSLTPSLSS